MAIARKSHRPNIRSHEVKATASPAPTTIEPPTATKRTDDITHHNPLNELKTIAMITIPLFILLGIITYYDTKQAWVIPFAEWLTSIGQ